MRSEIIVLSSLDSLVSSAARALRLRTSTSEQGLKHNPTWPVQATLVDALRKAFLLTQAWSRSGGTVDSSPPPELDQLVEPDVVSLPRRAAGDSHTPARRQSLFAAIFGTDASAVLIGGPGSGKTTALKMIAERALTSGSHLPVLLRLRELESPLLPIEVGLRRLLGFGERVSADAEIAALEVEHQRHFLTYLDALGLIVLLDGLDEVETPEGRAAVLSDYSRLTAALKKTKFILASRTGSFSGPVPTTVLLELAPLSRAQVHSYASRRLQSPEEVSRFIEQVEASPYGDALTTPLLLEQLCAVYMRIGSIPNKPRSFYRKMVYLFLAEWDQQRSIRRSSHYARFDVERKYEFLAHLAFSLTVKRLAVFAVRELLSSIEDIAPIHDLPARDASAIAAEIESHTGLIVQESQGRYSFAHRSIQEYLCADYLIRSPSLRFLKTHLHFLPNELAIATALSSNSAEYLVHLTFDHIVHSSQRSQFASVYVSRLVSERPDFVRSHELDIALFCLAILVDSFRLFADLNIPGAELEAARAAFEYYRVDQTGSRPQLLAHSRHPRLQIPFSLDLAEGVANRLVAAEKLAQAPQ